MINSLGKMLAMARTYPIGSVSLALAIAPLPSASKSLTSALRNSLDNWLRAATGLPPGFRVSPGLMGFRLAKLLGCLLIYPERPFRLNSHPV